jgi:hypothetical protein
VLVCFDFFFEKKKNTTNGHFVFRYFVSFFKQKVEKRKGKTDFIEYSSKYTGRVKTRDITKDGKKLGTHKKKNLR